MSVARNNLIRQINRSTLFASAKPVLSTNPLCTWNQGDILVFDPTLKFLRPATGVGDAALVVGVARVSITNGIKPSPYALTAVDGSQAIDDVAGPEYGSIFQMVLSAGQTFVPGSSVYLTSDPQTVAATGTQPIGLYQGLQVTQGSTAYGDVLVGSTYLAPSGTVRLS